MSSAKDWQRVLDSVRAAKDPQAVQRRLTWWHRWFELRLVLRCLAWAMLLVGIALTVVELVVVFVG